MRSIILFFFLSSFSTFLLAQTTALNAGIQELNSLLAEVNDGNYTYQQEIKAGELPYQLTFTRTTTSIKKGSSEVEKAIFNLGLMDKKLVRYKAESKKIRVFVGSGKQEMIKLEEDGKSEGYEDEFYILCDDIDNARALEEKIETLIPLAKTAWEKDNQLPEDFADLMTFVKANVQEIKDDEDKIVQKLVPDDTHIDRVSLSVEVYDEKGLDEKLISDFAVGDLNPKKIEMDISKNQITVEAETIERQNYIATINEKEQKKFTNKVQFNLPTPEAALIFKDALSKLAMLGKEKIATRQAKPTDLNTAKELLSTTIKSFKIEDEQFKQTIAYDQELTTFTLETSDDKGTEVQKWLFNFSDFAPKAVGKFSGENGSIEIETTQSEKYIQAFEDGEQENYEKELTFLVPDVETMRILEAILPFIIQNSSSEVNAKDLDWLVNELNIKQGEWQQALKKEAADNACKLELTLREEEKKSTDETLSTFNLHDLNIKSIELDIKGKEVFVQASTIGNEKIIQQYENGEKLTYEDEINLLVSSIASGKQVVATLQQLIKGCKQ